MGFNSGFKGLISPHTDISNVQTRYVFEVIVNFVVKPLILLSFLIKVILVIKNTVHRDKTY